MLIEIAEKKPAAPGKKVAKVVAVGGASFDIWPEKLADIEVGKRYEVETADREFNGRTYRRIEKATLYATSVTVDSAVATKAAARTSAPGPNGYSNGGNKDLQIFVQGVLQALIKAGQVGNNKEHLYHTTTMLMQLFRHTLGVSSIPVDHQD